MNKQEILEILNDVEEIASQFFNDEVNTVESVLNHPKWYSDEFIEFVSLLQLNGVDFVQKEQFGGEGMGDEFWCVYAFTTKDETFFVKFDGSYASYCGAEYSECFEVESKEVTVKQYFRKI